MADDPVPLVSRTTVKTHRMRWFVYTDEGKVRRRSTMTGRWDYDVECACGWETATGGGPKTYIDKEVWGHRLSVELGLDDGQGQERHRER